MWQKVAFTSFSYRKVIFTCVALSIFVSIFGGAHLLQRTVKVQDDVHAAKGTQQIQLLVTPNNFINVYKCYSNLPQRKKCLIDLGDYVTISKYKCSWCKLGCGKHGEPWRSVGRVDEEKRDSNEGETGPREGGLCEVRLRGALEGAWTGEELLVRRWARSCILHSC